MKKFCMFAAAIALLTGCSTISVRRDFDPATDFTAMKNYAWKHASQPKTGNPRLDNDLLDARIRSAVDTVLASKGFNGAEPAESDFLVAYFVEYKQRISGNTWSFGIGSGWYDGYGGVGFNSAISDYDEGYLTVDIISSKSGKTIWRGVGRGVAFDDSYPDKVTRIVGKAVSKILGNFPPEK